MTALASRRHRSTVLGAAIAITTIVLAVALGAIGALTLYNSTEGADASDDRPEVVFPDTPTGLLAAVDDDGRLASLALLTVWPSGAGGSIVTVPVSADASSGDGKERLPVAETAALAGPEAVEREMEILLGLTIDSFEVVDRATLEQLLEPVGVLEVDLPTEVTNADGEVVAEAGTQTLDSAEAAEILTARDPDMSAVDQYPAAGAVWAAVAEAVGEGVESGSGPSTTVGQATTAAASVSEVMAQVLAGPVGQRGLATKSVPASRNPRRVDVTLLDRAEVAFVLGQIAPARVSAPNPALTFRVEVPHSDADLASKDLTADELAYQAISQLLFVRGNVRSVDMTDGPVPATTTIEVADDSLLNSVTGTDVLFGEVDARVADTQLVGVDAVVRLGESYVDFVEAQESADE